MIKRTLPAILGLVLLGGLSACASKTETTEAKPAAAAKPQEEYVSQSSVGSWIPKKVKKSEVQPTSEADTNAAQRDIDQLQRRGATAARGPGD
jgi:hypothetical protein